MSIVPYHMMSHISISSSSRSALMANSASNHNRSASFPPESESESESNPKMMMMMQRIEQKLLKLRECEASSTSEMETLSIALSGLPALYKSALHLPFILPHSLNPFLHVSSLLLHICTRSNHVLVALRDAVSLARSSLHSPNTSVLSVSSTYLSSRKHILRTATGVTLSLSHLQSQAAAAYSSQQHSSSELSRVLTCVTIINISVMASLLHFLMSKPRSGKQGLLYRLGLAPKMSGKASVLPSRNGNKLGDLDAAIHALQCFPGDADILGISLKRLETMEDALRGLEEDLSHIFAVLTNTRASLLNIISS